MNKKFLIPACFIVFVAVLISYQTAFAHTSITVGNYTVEIGWVNEPALVGQQNAIVVNVSTTSDHKPVEDVSGLTVGVSYGGRKKKIKLPPTCAGIPAQTLATNITPIPGQNTTERGGHIRPIGR